MYREFGFAASDNEPIKDLLTRISVVTSRLRQRQLPAVTTASRAISKHHLNVGFSCQARPPPNVTLMRVVSPLQTEPGIMHRQLA